MRRMNQEKTIDQTVNKTLDAFKSGGPWPASLECIGGGIWNGLRGDDSFEGSLTAQCRLTGRKFIYDLDVTDVTDVREI